MPNISYYAPKKSPYGLRRSWKFSVVPNQFLRLVKQARYHFGVNRDPDPCKNRHVDPVKGENDFFPLVFGRFWIKASGSAYLCGSGPAKTCGSGSKTLYKT